MKDQIVFDTTVTDADRDNIGAYVRSSDGTLIDSVTIATVDRLAVDATMNDGAGNDITSTGGALDVNIKTSDISINVDLVNGAEYAEDAAHTTADVGNFVLAVRQDSLASSTSTDGDYGAFKIDSVGSLYVRDTNAAALLTTIDADTGSILADTNAIVVDLAAIEVEQLAQGVSLDTISGDTTSIDATLTALSKAEDSVHGSGDQGIMGLAVRNDTLATLADTDGDYAPMQVDASGAMYVNVSNAITTSDAALANTALATTKTSVDTTAGGVDLIGTDLANRKYLFVHNAGPKKMFIGTGTVTTNDFPIPHGATLELRAGASIDVKAITSAATTDARMLELS